MKATYYVGWNNVNEEGNNQLFFDFYAVCVYTVAAAQIIALKKEEGGSRTSFFEWMMNKELEPNQEPSIG